MNIKKKTAFIIVLTLILCVTVAAVIIISACGNSNITVDKALILANAFTRLNEKEVLEADVSVSVDCGVIEIDEDMKFYRWKADSIDVFAIDYGIDRLYFTKEKIFRENGNTVTQTEAEPLDINGLIDIAEYVYKNSTSECRKDEEGYVYTVDLTEDAMEKIVCYIAPEAKDVNVSFKSGSICVTVRKNEIESVEFSVNGDIDLFLTVANASFGAKLDFNKENSNEKLPDTIKNSLN